VRVKAACSSLLGTGIQPSFVGQKRRGNRRYYQHHEVLLIPTHPRTALRARIYHKRVRATASTRI